MNSLTRYFLCLSLISLCGEVVRAAADPPWDLSTEDTHLSLTVSNDQPVLVVLENPAIRRNWATPNMGVPLMARVRMAGQEYQTQWVFQQGQLNPSGELTLTFANDKPRLELRSIWRARPGRGPIQHWIEIVNRSGEAITVFHQASLTLSRLQSEGPANVWWIKRGGSNASTQGGTFGEPLLPGLNLNLVSDCEDGASPVPWLAVQQGDKEGLYVGWEFSGLGVVEAKADAGSAQLGLMVGLRRDFQTDVFAGETFLAPPAFVGCYAGDIDEGSYSLHRFILEKLRPSVPAGYPDPTLAYNLYLDAGGSSAKEADVLKSAQTCYDIGFETFMPDAMWFPEAGDWRWDPKRFPRGIGPLEEFVHGRGMKLALWCAWSNGGISADAAALSVRGPSGHPTWFNSSFAADWKPGPFYGGQICLGSPEAKAWAIQKVQWLVGHHQLDYLKHDCGPIVNRCTQNTHRHHYGVDVGYWAALGYYEVQEQLRNAFPKVLLENCSGGGHIKDFGAMKRTHYVVTTDTLSNLPDRQSIYDSTFAFPPLILQAYTYERAYPVKGDDPGPFLWRSGMMGAWQIDPTNTRIWTDEEKASAQRASDIYKMWIRPMLQDVKVHHILPRPDGLRWDGLFYWSAAIKKGMLSLFRPDAAEEQQIVRLKGLDRTGRYWVWSEDASVPPGIRTGQELMQEGLSAKLPAHYSSDLIYVQAAELGKPKELERPGAFRLGEVQTTSDEFSVAAKLQWEVSAGAHGYRVLVSKTPDFAKPIVESRVLRPTVSVNKLLPQTDLYWKVEAISFGGTRGNEGPAQVFSTPGVKALRGIKLVSDLKWSKESAGANNTVHRDTNYGGNLISLGGKIYPKGVWTHAFPDSTPADVVIDIRDQNFAAFVADAGVEDSAGAGSVQFQVLVDGGIKAESPIMKSGAVYPFRVDVTSAKEVTLRVLNGGDGYNCDHAAWGLARFVERGASDPLAKR